MHREIPNVRYERKFVAPHLSEPEAVALIRGHPSVFREVFPRRTINNIYFDSPGLEDYLGHIYGISDRSKMRIRWYGLLGGEVVSPVLEQKLRRGGVSGKAAWPLVPMHLNGKEPCAEFESALRRSELPEIQRLCMLSRRPTLVNRYDRRYFISGNGRFRLTIDANIRFLKLTRNLELAKPVGVLSGVVLELKYEPCVAFESSSVANALPIRPSRCSKYVLGLECALNG